MFGKKKQKQEENLNFETKNYAIKDSFNSDKLVVANLEYISSEPTSFGSPMVKRTEQRYLFEIVNGNGKKRYREIFTGFIADSEEAYCFDLPYVVNMTALKEEQPIISKEIPKYALLLLLNEINTKKETKKLKKENKSFNVSTFY